MKKNLKTRSNQSTLGYQNLEDRKLMAVGAFTGFFDGSQITFDSDTPAITVGQLPENAQIVVGDWNGDGAETPGVFHEGQWILDRTGNGFDQTDIQLSFGWPTDIAVAGDWDGDGVDTVGTFRNGAWYQDHDGDGYTHIQDDFPIQFGLPGDTPVVGNWDGDSAGTDSPGIFRNGTWVLDQTGNGYDIHDPVLEFGAADAQPFAADWNGDGRDTPGVLQAEGWYFRESNGYVGFESPLQFAHNQGIPLAGNGIRSSNEMGIDLSATNVAYNQEAPESQRATIDLHIHNPNEVEFTSSITLVWASTPNGDAPFKALAGSKTFTAAGANRTGNISIDFSADELTTRPAQAKYLIAVANADQAVGERNFENNVVNMEVERKLYLNFDGIDLSRHQLETWAGDDWGYVLDLALDRDRNGIEVERFFDGHANRDEIIRGIHYQIQQDLAPFDITVQLTSGGAVSDEGATTIFFGANSIGVNGSNIASDIDYFNNNETDIGFVVGYDLGDIQQTIFANADIALHEAGHTYGLHHVFSGNFPETMGYTYSTGNFATRDTGFLDLAFSEFVRDGVDHSGGLGALGPQNSFQRVAQSFGYAQLDRSGAEPSVFGNGNLNALSDAGLFDHYGHAHGQSKTVVQNDKPSHDPDCGCALCQVSRPAIGDESQLVQPLVLNSDLTSSAEQEKRRANAATLPITIIPLDKLSLAGHVMEADNPILLAEIESFNERRYESNLTQRSRDQTFENFDEFEIAELV